MQETMQKNTAGGWLNRRLLDRAFSTGMLWMVFAGCGLGFMIGSLPAFDGRFAILVAWGILGAMVLSLGALHVFIRRTDASWGLGLRAERKVGDLIEHALTQGGCAWAHDVKEALGLQGNIDHVVMTPMGVWVVETKARWLSKRRFGAALRQIEGNVRRVRQHLGTSLPVRGAMVIADRSHHSMESDHDRNGEQVTVFGAKRFWAVLRRERVHGLDNGLRPEVTTTENMVWNLGSTRHDQA